MNRNFKVSGNALIWQFETETIRIEGWGLDGIRIRATKLSDIKELPGALLPPNKQSTSKIEVGQGYASIRNGKVKGVIENNGRIHFYNCLTGALLLQEPEPMFWRSPSRLYKTRSSELFHLEARFEAQPGERFYGLGQHQHGKLNQKGCVIELEQRNTEVCIPFLLSNMGYGFLWNNPAIGRVELSENGTRWVAETTRQMDYLVIAGDTPADILEKYADATGHPLELPEFAAGFWQCKLRYYSQDELLNVAREHKQRGLPLSVIVSDYFHWTMMGDWKFDPKYWPDPVAMVKELDEMGVKLMVSIWATVNINSQNYEIMRQNGWLTLTERGLPAHMVFLDGFPNGRTVMAYYDATNPDARRFVWEQVRENYYKKGIKVWWLDACEPEIYPSDHDNMRYMMGNGLEVGCIYPLLHQQGFWEGMSSEGEKEIITLSRSAWAGSQRYGTAVWSGDIRSDFETLRAQVPAGLNIGLSGIPWWTTDIGGFLNGDPSTPYFRELIVRWFQYGVFCPLFRLHGARLPFDNTIPGGNGAPNEVWTFGEPAYSIIRQLMFLRERLKPYIMNQMHVAHEKGIPPMRPSWFDFTHDSTCWNIEDQFMLGPDLLVAPVLHEGHRSRRLYLPSGTNWIDAWTGECVEGGKWIEVGAPLERIPAYWRDNSPAIFRFDQLSD